MKNRHMKYKRMIPCVLILFVAFATMPQTVFSLDPEFSWLGIPADANYTITNAEGEVLHFDQSFNGAGNSGDMYVERWNPIYSETSPLMADVIVKRSSSFTVVNNEEETTYINSHEVKGEENVKLSTEGETETVTVTGKNAEFTVCMFLEDSFSNVKVIGHTTSSCTISETEEGLQIDGISGRFSIDVTDIDTLDKHSLNLFSLGGTVLISDLDKKNIEVDGAINLSPKNYDDVRVLHIRKMTDPNKLFVYWGEVKNAMGYVVYRYDPDAERYKEITTIRGKSNRMWVDDSVTAGKSYSYKVAYYTFSVFGEMNVRKRSYSVTVR